MFLFQILRSAGQRLERGTGDSAERTRTLPVSTAPTTTTSTTTRGRNANRQSNGKKRETKNGEGIERTETELCRYFGCKGISFFSRTKTFGRTGRHETKTFDDRRGFDSVAIQKQNFVEQVSIEENVVRRNLRQSRQHQSLSSRITRSVSNERRKLSRHS